MSDSDSLESYERPPLPAIHDAVQNLDVDGVRRELAAGANVDVLDEEGYTPLYYACKATSIAKAIREEKVRERDAIVAALLRAGANVEGRPSTYSFTPLLGAVWDRRGPPSDVVAQLIAAGADVEASDNYFHVLYVAAQHGRGDTVSRLLAAGADPHRRSSNDHALTALHGATLTCNSHAYPPLLRAGAALPELDRRDAYLDKIAATPGGFPAYEREHRRRLTAVFANKFPMLPVEVISHIVLLWGHCGDYLYSDTAPPAPAPPAPEPPEPTSGEEASDDGAGGVRADPALASAAAPSALSPSTEAATSTAAGSGEAPLASSSPASAAPASAGASGLASRRRGVGVPCSEPCSDSCGVRPTCCARAAESSRSATLFSSASLRTPATMAPPAKSSLRCSSPSTSCSAATTWSSEGGSAWRSASGSGAWG